MSDQPVISSQLSPFSFSSRRNHIPALWFGFHSMLRKPARRARMANSLALLYPCFRTENCFLAITYGLGLHVAFQYSRTLPPRRTINFCTPTIPDELFRRGNSAHQRRDFRLGGPNFAINIL
jgi:hypothetical protein